MHAGMGECKPTFGGQVGLEGGEFQAHEQRTKDLGCSDNDVQAREVAALRTCDEMRQMLATLRSQMATLLQSGVHANCRSGATADAASDREMMRAVRAELEDTRAQLEQQRAAAQDLQREVDAAHREIQAKDRQLACFLNSLPEAQHQEEDDAAQSWEGQRNSHFTSPRPLQNTAALL